MMKTIYKSISTISPRETESIGKKIGSKLKGGEIIELISDLGGGKTTFVRGLALGFGSKDEVSSPSFTIKNVYKTRGKEIWHFDFYRLESVGVTGAELAEAIDDKKIVSVIEWARDASDVLPKERLTIRFDVPSENERKIEILAPNKLMYLVEEL